MEGIVTSAILGLATFALINVGMGAIGQTLAVGLKEGVDSLVDKKCETT